MALVAYITNRGASSVSVIDTATNTILTTINSGFGSTPFGVAYFPNQQFVYVTNNGGNTVSKIDTSTNTVVATIIVGSNPVGVAITPDGSSAYVANLGDNTVSEIDTATDTVVDTFPVGGGFLYGVAITPDGAFVYVTTLGGNVQKISTTTNTVVATIPIAITPFGIVVSPDGTKVYVAVGNTGNNVTVIDVALNTVITTVPVGVNPIGITITPDGAFVYVANGNSGTVSVVRTSDNTVVDTITVGTNPFGVDITPDGAFVYVANGTDNTVSVIRTSDNTVIDTVAVGSQPAAFGKFIGLSVPLALESDLAVTKNVDDPNPSVGQNVTFTVDASNLGPDDNTGVVVNDILPAGYGFVSATPSTGSITASPIIGGNGLIEWTIGAMLNGATAQLLIVATVLAPPNDYLNTAIISGDNLDPNEENNSASAVVTPAPQQFSDLAVVKIIDNSSPIVGSNVTFTVTASNLGPDNDTGVVVNDILPAGYGFVSATPTIGSITAQPAPGGNGLIEWTIGNFLAAQNGVLTIIATVLAPPNDYQNTATISGTNIDPNLANNTSSVQAVPLDIIVTKSFTPSTIAVGGSSILTVSIVNNTPDAITGITFSDTYPIGIINATPLNVTNNMGGVLTAVAGGTGFSLVGGSILPGMTGIITIEITANQPGTFNNTTSPIISSVGILGTATGTLVVVVTPPTPVPPSKKKKKKGVIVPGCDWLPIRKAVYPNGAPVTVSVRNITYYLYSEDATYYWYCNIPPANNPKKN